MTIQLILSGMAIGTFPVYKANKNQLVRNDIIAGIPFIIILDKTKTFFSIIDSNNLPLTGGTLNGNVNINGNLVTSQAVASRGTNQNAVGTFYLDGRKTASDPYTGYLLRSFDNNFAIYTSSNSTAAKKVATYNATTDTWDFNTVGLTKNGVPVVIENEFNNKLEGNGYQYLPGGLLMQWGEQDRVNDVTPVTFLIPFSNNVLNIQLTLTKTDAPSNRNISAGEITNTGFNLYMTSWELRSYWLAIGY